MLPLEEPTNGPPDSTNCQAFGIGRLGMSRKHVMLGVFSPRDTQNLSDRFLRCLVNPYALHVSTKAAVAFVDVGLHRVDKTYEQFHVSFADCGRQNLVMRRVYGAESENLHTRRAARKLFPQTNFRNLLHSFYFLAFQLTFTCHIVSTDRLRRYF